MAALGLKYCILLPWMNSERVDNDRSCLSTGGSSFPCLTVLTAPTYFSSDCYCPSTTMTSHISCVLHCEAGLSGKRHCCYNSLREQRIVIAHRCLRSKTEVYFKTSFGASDLEHWPLWNEPGKGELQICSPPQNETPWSSLLFFQGPNESERTRTLLPERVSLGQAGACVWCVWCMCQACVAAASPETCP